MSTSEASSKEPLHEPAVPLHLTRDDILFTEKLPSVIDIECTICFRVMLHDDLPSLTSCCGHHFCAVCVTKITGPCPVCKEASYNTLVDKGRARLIGGLRVYCIHKKSGCKWSGDLKELSGHVNRGNREGECQFESVDCQFSYSGHEAVDACKVEPSPRRDMTKHEKDCRWKFTKCKFCQHQDTEPITRTHYAKCPKYPVTCSNKCDPGLILSRDSLSDHLSSDCPLQLIECEFKWVGCNDTVLRKDLLQHLSTKRLEHQSLLAKTHTTLAAEEKSLLEKENSKLKKEVEELSKGRKDLVDTRCVSKRHRIHIHLDRNKRIKMSFHDRNSRHTNDDDWSTDDDEGEYDSYEDEYSSYSEESYYDDDYYDDEYYDDYYDDDYYDDYYDDDYYYDDYY